MSDHSEQKHSGARERRQYSRVEFDADVTLTQEGQTYCAELVDISLNGILVAIPGVYQIRTDKPCAIEVTLSADTVIKMQAALVHSSSKYLGFHCTSIDMESIVFLRRLIEVNLDDPAASERVLSELLRRQQELAE